MEVFQLLGETARDTWRPVPAMDGEVQDYHDQIVHHLRARGMSAHAALLAKANRLPDRLQWFTDIQGPVQHLAVLLADRQQPIVDNILRLLEDIRQEGLRLGAERSRPLRDLGDLIDAALAGTDALQVLDVCVIDGQPVIAWGVRPVAGPLPTVGLFGRGSTPLRSLKPIKSTPAPAPPSTEEPPPPFAPPNQPPSAVSSTTTHYVVRETRYWFAERWPLRLLSLTALLVTIAAIFVWLFPDPGTADLRAAPICAPPPGSDIMRDQSEEAGLRGRISQLERDLAGEVRQCASIHTVPGPSQVPTPQEVQRRLQEQHAQTGKVQVSLAWNSLADLDLHIRCPDGEMIGPHRGGCGGMHDVDMNFPPENHMSQTPVEHVVWPSGAPAGTYSVIVDYYQANDRSPPVSFVVTIEVGTQTKQIRGVAAFRGGTSVLITTFDVP